DEPRVAQCPRKEGLVVVADLFVFVEHGEAHDVPRDIELTVPGDLVDPAARHPRPRARRVEPEVDGGGTSGLCCGGHAPIQAHATDMALAFETAPAQTGGSASVTSWRWLMTKKVHTLETEIVPDGIPVLSPGMHRRPSQAACFMEFASYLA